MKRLFLLLACFTVIIGCASFPTDTQDDDIMNSDVVSMYRDAYGEPKITSSSSIYSLGWIINNENQYVFLSKSRSGIEILSVNGKSNTDKSLKFIPLLPRSVEKTNGGSLSSPTVNYEVLLRRNYGETISLQKTVYNDGRYAFYLIVDYHGRSWRFMTGNIEIKCGDGEVHTFTDDHPTHNVLDSGRVSETLFVTLPEAFVAEMEASESIKLQYYTDPVCLLPEATLNIKLLKEAE